MRDLLDPDSAPSVAVFDSMNLTDLPGGLTGTTKISSWDDLPESMGSPAKKWLRNEFGELFWNYNAEAGGYFMVDTPNTNVFTGFVHNRSFEYQGLTLRPGQTRLDWATISLVKAKGEPGQGAELTAGSYLLAASGWMQNTGSVFKKVSEVSISTAKGYGGTGGTAPILCEGIPAALTFKANAAHVKAFSLNEAGDRAEEIPVTGMATEARVEIDPKYRTLWYELVVE